MKILYIHQYFTTNEGTGGTRSYDVSKYLIEDGHQVTMVCGLSSTAPFAPIPWYRPFRTELIDGIKVIICNVNYSNNLSVPGRVWAFVGFALLATLACLRERAVDIVFATSTPLTVGIPGRVAASLKRVPFVFEVRDLWPEDLLAAGRMKPGLSYKAWQWLEAFCYAKARKIILVSKGFHDRMLERGFPSESLVTILLGADGQLFKDVKPDHEYMAQHGLSGKTIAIFTGAHGDANGLSQVLDAAALLCDRPDIAIVLIGQGKTKADLQCRAKSEGLDNIHFLAPVSKTKLSGILAASHIGLMILKQITRPRWVTPNKLFDYMFTGLPTIVNFPGTTAELVETDQVGIATAPGSATDLAEKIRYYADNPEVRAATGRTAQKTAWEKYDRRTIANQLEAVFLECINSSSGVR